MMELQKSIRWDVLDNFVSEKKEFVRFNWTARAEHLLLILSFTSLVVTGVPQRFFDTPWGEGMVLLMGGIETVRSIHRLFAAVMIVESVFHVANVLVGLVRRPQVPAMTPRLKDVKDMIQELLYFVGRRKEPAAFDRYDYAQKFEYWGLVWGTVVMILTGLVMIFPAQFTLFLPGELVPAAKGIHGGEALLALLVILTWHLYGTHLKPNKFPFDSTIFTGRISEERMREEHPLEYARLVREEEVLTAEAAESAQGKE